MCFVLLNYNDSDEGFYIVLWGRIFVLIVVGVVGEEKPVGLIKTTSLVAERWVAGFVWLRVREIFG